MDNIDDILRQWNTARPDLDVRPMGVFGRLKRLNDHLMAEMTTVFDAHGLTAAGFDVLATLRRSGTPYALSPSDLIAWTMVTSGTMTNRLDRLEKSGLIERRPNPSDGRGSVVALTSDGLRLIDVVITEHVALQQHLVSSLPVELPEQLDGILRTWLGAFAPADGKDGD